MKKLIIAGLVCFGGSAQAVEAKDIFGSIFEIIINEIGGNAKPGSPSNPIMVGWDEGVILKNSGDKLVLGQVTLDENKTMARVGFPACNNHPRGNKPVSRVRLYVNEDAAFVESVRVTFQNGESKLFNIGETFYDGEGTGWLNLRGARCVTAVRVIGEVEQPWGNSSNDSWNGGGWNGNGPWGNNNGWGNGGWNNGGPGGKFGGPGWNNGSGKPTHNKRLRSFVSIVGLKA